MKNPPAFPCSEFTESDGMSLLDYFAAHAPHPAPDWFQPVFTVPRPSQPANAAWCDGCKGDSDCDNSESCHAMREYMSVVSLWSDQRKLSGQCQWPWVWAKGMLAEREAQR